MFLPIEVVEISGIADEWLFKRLSFIVLILIKNNFKNKPYLSKFMSR